MRDTWAPLWHLYIPHPSALDDVYDGDDDGDGDGDDDGDDDDVHIHNVLISAFNCL